MAKDSEVLKEGELIQDILERRTSAGLLLDHMEGLIEYCESKLLDGQDSQFYTGAIWFGTKLVRDLQGGLTRAKLVRLREKAKSQGTLIESERSMNEPRPNFEMESF